MPGGGDECIRNSLVGKMVSMNSKYRGGGGAITWDVTPVFRVDVCFVGLHGVEGFRGQ